jgi:murein DD-endopeptidase MepM/ murein hydrolase activator NlpD
MPRWHLLLVLLLGAWLLASCDGESADQALVRLKPAATATPTPQGPTPTPVPPPELILSTTDVYQGGAIMTSVVGAVESGTVTFLDREYQLIPGDRSVFTFVGVDAEDPTGTYPMRIDFVLTSGATGSLTQDITVLATEWEVDWLEFDPEKQQYLDEEVVRNEDAILDRVYSTVTPEKMWDGIWHYPVQGDVTARFGQQRSVGGSEPSGHHSGTDIGANEGIPVAAANSGTVVLARELTAHGNTVIIDHGGGLFSGYSHLSQIDVAEGQAVAAGDTVGLVGNTGLSTGPHLHWEMVSHGIRLDALRFVDGTNGF